jgi:FKBP-type peptidyl-prolyl cis-trans isomerase|eukprot:TRINITY_DN73799_c0_g1_i1.p2 TRINITY_DN73799_c0_g1~~TRINITY_DN73799_c0_g1_i1.p2  ORF type:complete len:109 (-),score=8.29 TRINITY_DN73799_c0_g1_i1:73-399(-)
MSSFNVEIVQNGSGPKPTRGSTVTVHYTGKLTNGKVFDSSVTRGTPFKFTLGVGQVIKGWDEGFAQLNAGAKAVITCPPDYAYGARGFPPVIPPNSTLIFEIELISFQ